MKIFLVFIVYYYNSRDLFNKYIFRSIQKYKFGKKTNRCNISIKIFYGQNHIILKYYYYNKGKKVMRMGQQYREHFSCAMHIMNMSACGFVVDMCESILGVTL